MDAARHDLAKIELVTRNTVVGDEIQKATDFLAAPQGFEPRYADPESAVLPLNEGAVMQQFVRGSAASIVWAAELSVNRERTRCGHQTGLLRANYKGPIH
jgi:hypothetical protein